MLGMNKYFMSVIATALVRPPLETAEVNSDPAGTQPMCVPSDWQLV